MEMVYTSAACACVVILVVAMMIRKNTTPKLGEVHRLPSPPAWPIFGHLHMFMQHPPLVHQCLHKLALRYGPLFYLKLGTMPTLVVSSPHWAKEFLHTHDREFVDRPPFESSKRLFYNCKSLFSMNHGPTWRHLRNLYTTQLLAVKRVEMFEKHRHDEMAMLIKLVRSHASVEGAAVDIRKLMFGTLGNMFTRMLFSKRSFDTMEALDQYGRSGTSRFCEMIEEMSVLMTSPLLGDFIPWLSWLDTRSKRRMDTVAKEMDALLEGVLVDRIESSTRDATDEEDLDYLDLLQLNLHKEDGNIDKESIKCILLDLLAAGVETSATTIEWAMAELLKNPSCMKKLQEELGTLCEKNKCLKEADLAKLTYLQAVVKETLRLHPPLTLNYRVLSDTLDHGLEVGGYHVPKKSLVLVNNWALGRDPTFWGPEALSFSPERFLITSAPDVRGKNFELLPFGTGRRGCPGMNSALTIVPFVVANLVQAVNWSIPYGVSLDLSEVSTLTTAMAKHLVAKPSLRTTYG